MEETGKKTRRSSKARTLVRGEPVVRSVMEATLEELGRVGYGALRIEDVASRAKVNKTTVYRRWPTKEDLVRAALLSATGITEFRAPNTGSLRGDMIAMAQTIVERTCSTEGQGLMRLMFSEGPGSELMTIAMSMRESFEETPRAILQAAKERGELSPEIDARLLFKVLGATLHRQLLVDRKSVDDAMIGRLVDLLLVGALAPHARGGHMKGGSAIPSSAEAVK